MNTATQSVSIRFQIEPDPPSAMLERRVVITSTYYGSGIETEVVKLWNLDDDNPHGDECVEIPLLMVEAVIAAIRETKALRLRFTYSDEAVAT